MENCQTKTHTYSVICEEMISEEGREYTAYGIRAESKDNALVISDISTEKEEINTLVELCNREELDIIHIYDVVEDFLAL